MRGLICKDLRLMLVQKNFFIMLAFVAFVCMAALDDPAFVVMYVTLIFTSFLLSTMSYDEFDNGYPFLFTLPITRKLYVQEKYVLGMAGGSIAWLLSTLLAGIAFLPDAGGLSAAFLVRAAICGAADARLAHRADDPIQAEVWRGERTSGHASGYRCRMRDLWRSIGTDAEHGHICADDHSCLASYVDGTVCLAHPRALRAHRSDILRYKHAYHGTPGILIQAPFNISSRSCRMVPLS